MKRNRSARRARPILGTLFDVRIEDLDASADPIAPFEAAFSAAAEVHRLMSAYDPESDVSRINRCECGKPLQVHPWTYRVLQTACAIAGATGGLFDPCVAPLLQDAGYLPRFVRSAGCWGDHRDIELLDQCRIRTRRPLQITLDGIAKGFAVDRAVAALRDRGIEAGVVNAGGDLRIFGPLSEPVSVRDPEDPVRLAQVGTLHDGAMATSSVYFSCREVSDSETSHIFHPGRAESFVERASASVIARECMIADALSKPLVLDEAAARPVLDRFGALGIVLRPCQSRPTSQ